MTNGERCEVCNKMMGNSLHTINFCDAAGYCIESHNVHMKCERLFLTLRKKGLK